MEKESVNEVETWNYRVMRKKYEGEYTYEIHEVYYDKEGRAMLNTERAMSPLGMDVKELSEDLKWMKRALKKPVLDYYTREEVK